MFQTLLWKVFCFRLFYGIMIYRKTWVHTTKWSTSFKIPNFQNGGKSPCTPMSKVGSKFKCLQFIHIWKENFVRINIVLRTRVQKWTYFDIFSNELPRPELFYPTFIHFISLTLFSVGLTNSYNKITNKYQLEQKI